MMVSYIVRVGVTLMGRGLEWNIRLEKLIDSFTNHQGRITADTRRLKSRSSSKQAMLRDDILNKLNIRLDELPARLKFTAGTNGHRQILRFLITGGCGYFAYELATAIHGLGGHVTLFDIQIPPKIEKNLSKSLVFLKGDICDYEALLDACEKVDCVFHVASFGMTGKDQLNRDKTHRVNVLGTKNVIKACREVGVSKLIYTSTYNVVFGKTPIIDGDETVPYAPKHEMVDWYSISKQEADKLILAANGTTVTGGKTLHTCCLRPAGIYGPGERRHIHRVAGLISKGLTVFRLGDALVDWTHVNNLVQAHLLVIPALSAATDHIAAGKAYFISDGNPMRLFEFLRPLFYGLGKSMPRYNLPLLLSFYLGYLMELIFWLMKPFVTLEPLLTRNEVLKMNITHFQKQQAAMKELHYRPIKYEFSDVVKLYIEEANPELSAKYSVYSEPEKTTDKTLVFGHAMFSLLLLCLFYCFVAT